MTVRDKTESAELPDDKNVPLNVFVHDRKLIREQDDEEDIYKDGTAPTKLHTKTVISQLREAIRRGDTRESA